jgi:hypothetical protein
MAATEAIEKIEEGVDPGAEKFAAKTAAMTAAEPDTVATLVAHFAERHLANLRSGEDVRRALEVYVVARWGGRPVRSGMGEPVERWTWIGARMESASGPSVDNRTAAGPYRFPPPSYQLRREAGRIRMRHNMSRVEDAQSGLALGEVARITVQAYLRPARLRPSM